MASAAYGTFSRRYTARVVRELRGDPGEYTVSDLTAVLRNQIAVVVEMTVQ
jgi:hypothetical protein